MCDLSERVDAGIGTARSVESEWFLGDDGEGVFDLFLDGVAIGLDLPAAEGSAVVGDGEFESHRKILRVEG